MVEEADLNALPTCNKNCFDNHIKTRKSRFAKYFYVDLEGLAWIRNPFKTLVVECSLNITGKENLTDLQSDTYLGIISFFE